MRMNPRMNPRLETCDGTDFLTIPYYDRRYNDVVMEDLKRPTRPRISTHLIPLDRALLIFALGLDGLPYGVFPDCGYSFEYSKALFGDDSLRHISCFGGFENAVCLQDTIGL